MSELVTSNDRLQTLIRKAQENPGTDFVVTDRHGDIGVAPKPERACKPTKPMSLAELFHLK